MTTELREVFFNQIFIDRLSKAINRIDKKFDSNTFNKMVLNKHWSQMALKQRMRHITNCLNATLDGSYHSKIKVLTEIVPQFKGFEGMVFPDFVEVYGLGEYETSIAALEYFTTFSSSEFAIRPFIINYKEKTMAQLLLWSKHKNYHVRRLASEGCRPMLPWGVALSDFKKDPSPIISILENLKSDESDYVRRSVANNLNDISKNQPHVVLRIAKKWKDSSAETNRIIKHACRTLLKKGNKEALALFGLKSSKKAIVRNLKIQNTKIKIGSKNGFSFSLKLNGNKKEKLRLEYGVYYVKSNNSLSLKVFQIGEKDLAPGKEITIQKSHSFKNMTTRKHYTGKHLLSIIVNGEEKAKINFWLI